MARTVQPVLQDLGREVEEASVSLGADRWQTFARVVLPTLFPPLLTGFALAFARAVGEYGSVIFISGNRPMRTEIVPLLIVGRLEAYDYAGATAIAVLMLLCLYVCPHDLLVSRDGAGPGAITATVEHILPIGPTVRLMLSRAGEPHTPTEAELDREGYRQLALREGEGVFVTPRCPRVFEAPAAETAAV